MITGRQVTVALAASALILAVILAISPRISVVANEASGDIYGIDILGVTKKAHILPDQQYPTH